MNKSKMMGVGAGIALLGIGAGSFDYNKFTDWNTDQIDPYTLKSVCRETTYIEMFGKMVVREGPDLPGSDCKQTVNYLFTEELDEGCSKDEATLTVKCDEAYKSPFL